jgi:hypothetical protein
MAQEGRDERGRFAKGHRLSVGNKGGRPPRSVEEEYCAAFNRACTVNDYEDIVRALVRKAKKGDLGAIRALQPYAQGLPARTIKVENIHTIDDDEWEQLARAKLNDVLGM